MKYYYNGKLVRTSKNEYKYGLLRSGEVISCSKTKATIARELENQKKAIKKDIAFAAKEENKKFIEDFTKTTVDEYIKGELAVIDSLQIIELEME